ncbi:hypothetical protein [Pseudoxanthomonas winnipegensis]|uniref:Uncharacterized protein n=1 Tax=Pseudoxanthomonas winnipegensis TaxID=2480810 RepID=A0A4Q8L9W3_9GAMM|nr:hypothetical protein [Pseudoxanthomonas winnipegensis]RZZ81431.1 hypothetical protein EA663_20635 [Pseudoxanthomonas winnipegensis]TAA25427.1 hypothetical protein EA660_08180 [Pseudoxanthomonas winnipegensis]
MNRIRPLAHIQRFAYEHAGAFLDYEPRKKGERARFRGPGPSLGPRVTRRRYVISVNLTDSQGLIVLHHPLSPVLSHYQAKKMLRRVRLTIPQAGIVVWQGVL